MALNKLINLAKYFNGGWVPKERELKWFAGLQANYVKGQYDGLIISKHESVKYSCVYFKNKESLYKVIEILGEATIKKALTLQY